MPVTGNPLFDTATTTQASPTTGTTEYQKADKLVATSKLAVSADGKTMTFTVTGTDAKGQNNAQRQRLHETVGPFHAEQSIRAIGLVRRSHGPQRGMGRRLRRLALLNSPSFPQKRTVLL